jgi:hypothetical protein
MKILFILFFISTTLISWSQENQLYTIENNRVVFEKVIDQPELNKQTLFDTLIHTLTHKFESRFVLKTKAGDLITGTGSINNTKFYKKDYNQLNFNFTIVVKENRFKIKFEQIIISDLIGNSKSIDSYLIDNDGSLKSNGKAKHFGTELNNALQRFLTEFSEALNTKEDASGDEDDW